MVDAVLAAAVAVGRSRRATAVAMAARMPASTSTIETAAASQTTGSDVVEFCVSMTGHCVPTKIPTAEPGMIAMTANGVHAVLGELKTQWTAKPQPIAMADITNGMVTDNPYWKKFGWGP